MYGEPGRMLGRFTMRNDRTLFLFVFATGDEALPEALALQKTMLRNRYGAGKWECRAFWQNWIAVRSSTLTGSARSGWTAGRKAASPAGDAAFCVPCLPDKAPLLP